MKEMTLLKMYPREIDYERRDPFEKYIKKTEGIFCPYCKSDNLVQEIGEGDYYLGKEIVCMDCKAGFHLSGSHDGYFKLETEVEAL